MKTIKKVLSIFVVIILFTTFSYSQQNPTLTDPEVASVAVVANNIDISYAEIALKRSKNKEVREFANRMVTDHNAIIQQAVNLVTRLSVTPKDNAVSKSLLETNKKVKKELKKVNKKEFDKLYIDNEIAYHKAVIAAVKGLLIPESDNKELKELLKTALPAFEAHLGHAEMIQKKL